jgi:lipase
MQHLVLAGQDTALWRWERGGDRRLLMLHCSLAHGGVWLGLAERLHGFQILAPDLPGHGASADPARADVAGAEADIHGLSTAVATELAERMASEVGQPIDLIGHSFGGTLALRLALQRPDLVRRLVLIEPVLFAAARQTPDQGPAAWQDHARRQQPIDAAIAMGDFERAAGLFHAIWGSGTALDRMPERLRRYIIERIRLVSAMAPDLEADRPGLLAPGRLEALGAPVLLAGGADSPAVIAAIHTSLAARMPRVRRLQIAGAGHMLPLTHAAQLAPQIQAHLDAVDPASAPAG